MSTIHPAIRSRIGADVDELIEEIRITGEQWGKAKADLQKLQRLRKIRLSQLREAYRKALADRGEKVTEQRVDDLARNNEDYKEIVLREYQAGVEESETQALHFARRNALDALFESMRQERAHMRLTENA